MGHTHRIIADKGNVSTLTLPQPDLRERALRAVNQLPPFSPTLSRLLASLAKEDVFYGEISAIIEKDTVLAGHVLKLVNSALYARSGTVNSVRHAVSILGLNKLRNVALSLSVSRMWNQVKTPKSWSQAAFNIHGVATAVMSDLIAQRITVRYPEGAFTAGLLHAVGKLMIAIALPEQYDQILNDYQNSSTLTMEEAELKHIGCCHAELGAAAMAQWKLPPDIEDAVRHQHRPKPDSGRVRDLSRLLHDAHYVVNHLDVMIPACASPVDTTIEEAFCQLGLEAQAAAIVEEYKAEFGAMKSFF